jgi:hypothetical protein
MATNKVTTNVIDMSGNTGGLVWAKGTEAQRPTGVAGDLRLNTTDSRLEYKDNADWKRFSEGAAGGPSFDIDFLVIGGAGGGGSNHGGGGGAGGLRTSYGSTSGGGSSNESKATISQSTNYTVTVGAGGAIGARFKGYATGGVGSDSVFSSITSSGGGYGGVGGSDTENGGPGGSGGGAGAYSNNLKLGGTATTNQGFAGGNANATGTFDNCTGGGGGASAIGGSGVSGSFGTEGSGGIGGQGLDVSISGAAVKYAGGGNGATNSTNPNNGGGGYQNGQRDGTVNSGSGGRGGPNPGTAALEYGAGGSGIVILRYPNTLTISVGSGLTSSTATDGSDKVTSFTAGTDTISFS